jgi:predicted transcriptional regulator
MLMREPMLFDETESEASAADSEGIADIEAGRVISHEAMKAWLLSWGKPGELPPPEVGD